MLPLANENEIKMTETQLANPISQKSRLNRGIANTNTMAVRAIIAK